MIYLHPKVIPSFFSFKVVDYGLHIEGRLSINLKKCCIIFICITKSPDISFPVKLWRMTRSQML